MPTSPFPPPLPQSQDTKALPHARVVRYARVKLEVTQGPDLGVQLEGAGDTFRIGASPECDIVLSDQTVSRHHCELSLISDGVRLRDPGSTNGIFVNKIRIKDAVLVPPFELLLGQTVLSVDPLEGSRERSQAMTPRFGDLVGNSAKMLELFADLERIAPAEVSVLVEGETGTGKELVAEAIHYHSPRKQGPFVVFDCGATAPSLVESELFGHERGAFTGALATRKGVFEEAHGGTLVLDELGELPLDLQPKLLRVLEKKEIKRLGSSKSVPVSVRLVASTNRNLQHEVARGNFRQDLYFRVAGAHVRVPPLRDRMDDLPLLIDHFFHELAPGKTHRDISADPYSMLQNHVWPGNVRELRNAVQRFLLTPDKLLTQSASSPQVRESTSALSMEADTESAPAVAPLRTARRIASDQFERQYVAFVLERTGGNVTRAAALAEVSRQMIQKLMRRHGVGF